jgi:hypothetical protein
LLDRLEANDEIGVVILARPYHNDPGVNHEICEELQKLGYPVLWQDTLPIDEDVLERLFGREVREGAFKVAAVHRGRMEEQLFGEHFKEDLGGQVHRTASQPDRPGALQLQVRPRCAHLLRHRGDHRAQRHALLLLQGHRREQAGRRDQDTHRDHRLFPDQRYRERLVAEKRKMAEIEAKLVAFERKLRAQSRAGQAALVTV